jgi:hypothetical protein
MKKKRCFLMAGGVLALAAVGYLAAQQVSNRVAGDGDGKDNGADRAAIQKATKSFVKAFQSGDAKAVAAHWTEKGEGVPRNSARFLRLVQIRACSLGEH